MNAEMKKNLKARDDTRMQKLTLLGNKNVQQDKSHADMLLESMAASWEPASTDE